MKLKQNPQTKSNGHFILIYLNQKSDNNQKNVLVIFIFESSPLIHEAWITTYLQ